MSEQDRTPISKKPRRSRHAGNLNGTQVTTLQRPANDDEDAWKAYWKTQGQPWRWEPEIDEKRQKYLDERRSITPDIDQHIYPFKDIDPKLSRADVEWLLATHENGRGPVNWNDESQRERQGLDLRGADLRNVHLHGLPLARIIAGPSSFHERMVEQDEAVTAHLEGTCIRAAHLEGACLIGAHLEEADLQLAHLEGAFLTDAHLEGALLVEARLEGVSLSGAHLEEAVLVATHLEGANLEETHLEGADLNAAFFDSSTNLYRIVLSNNKYGTASLCDIHWGDLNVGLVDWSTISTLGEEHTAAKGIKNDYGYEMAARAYRQLSIVLRNQGINDHAARFAYRAQIMQRKLFWYQRKFLSYLGSLSLALVSGYGYKAGRCFIAYALVIGLFATIYHLLGTHPAWNESIVISMTAFHGRGFFPEQFHPGDPQALAAAIEALVGLLIEITLIVTLTQRFFGK